MDVEEICSEIDSQFEKPDNEVVEVSGLSEEEARELQKHLLEHREYDVILGSIINRGKISYAIHVRGSIK